jgi:hypothetical protein
MPSKNPVIAVRLDPALYSAVEAMAAQQGRSLSNFVAQQLRTAVVVAPARVVSVPPGPRAKKHK